MVSHSQKRMLAVLSIAIATTRGVSAKSSVVSFDVDGREVDVVVPDCKSTQSPIILSLHAWATNKKMQQSIDQYSEHLGDECPVVVYPQGKERGALFGIVGFSWNAGGCCPNGNNDHVDDVGFLQHVISSVATKFGVDDQHVFVSGVSNGGMMANRLACADERVKALVAVSGPLMNGTDSKYLESFSCNRQVPVLHFHGLNDPVVPFDGCNGTVGPRECKSLYDLMPGKFAPMPEVAQYIADWRGRNGVLDGVGTSSFQNGTCSCTTWGKLANNVTLCTLQTEGHAWPGHCDILNKIPGMSCTLDADASAQAVAFFRRYLPPSSVVV